MFIATGKYLTPDRARRVLEDSAVIQDFHITHKSKQFTRSDWALTMMRLGRAYDGLGELEMADTYRCALYELAQAANLRRSLPPLSRLWRRSREAETA